MKLKEALKDVLSERELGLLVRAYDVVGDIAITIIPPELEAKEEKIGAAILAQQKNIRVVAKRNGIYSGKFRTIPLKIIAGEDRKETIHKEHGVRLRLNPEKVYFSVRSGTERKRLAILVQPGEDVLIMFSGIGAMPLVIAKINPAATVVGIEKNPIAHEYAVQNLALNRKIRNVTFLVGDVLDVVPTLNRRFDRVAMPLPQSGALFLDIALAALKRGCALHFYDFQPVESFDESVAKVQEACERNNRRLCNTQTVVCGHSSPRIYRICVDAKIG